MTTPCAKHDEHNTRLGDLCAKLKAIEERIHSYHDQATNTATDVIVVTYGTSSTVTRMSGCTLSGATLK